MVRNTGNRASPGAASPDPIRDSAPAVLDNGYAVATNADYYAQGGATKTEVLAALDATDLGYDGAGVTVGVLSDSFNELGGAATDEADGALPPAADIDVVEEDPYSGGSDEGRAMMQVVHDVASGADLDFYTADVSEEDFANGFLALAAAGCKVICDDVTYLDEPFFQTDEVASAIQTVEAEGVTVLTCAGNQASWGYQSDWNPISSTTYDGQKLTNTQNFGSPAAPAPTQVVANDSGYEDYLLLQWNQPFGEARTDLGILVFSAGRLIAKYSNAAIDGFTPTADTFGDPPSDPLVAVPLPNGANYQVAVEVLSGTTSGLMIDDVLFNDTPPSTVDLGDANAGTVIGHHASPDAVTVGAVDAANTPGNGGSLQNEEFSSDGRDTQLDFNYNGSAVSGGPLELDPVAVSGVDDIATSVFGAFLGTSAATPSVAGVVADMLEANPSLTPSQITAILEQTATAFGSASIAGAGLVNASAAIEAALALAASGPVTWTGSAGTNDWDTPGNWSDDAVPTTSSTVSITLSGAAVTHDQSGNDTIAALTVAAGDSLSIGSGALSIGGSGSVSGAIAVGTGALLSAGGSGLDFAGAGSLTVSAGGTANGIVLASGGSATVLSGGAASGTIIGSGGSETVYGSDYGATVLAGGGEIVASGGDALGVVLGGDGSLASGSVADAASQSVFYLYQRGIFGLFAPNYSGSVLVVSQGGMTSGATISSGGNGYIQGTAVDTTISAGGFAVLEGSATGPTMTETVVLNGGSALVYAGTASNTAIANGGVETVDGSDIDAAIAGQQDVFATAIGATVSSGGEQTAMNGGLLSATTVVNGGAVTVSSGGTASGIVLDSGGTLQILGGGSGVATTITGGGSATVSSGGTDADAIISGSSEYSYAVETLLGGQSISATVTGNAQLNLYGGSVTDATISSGYLSVLAGGIASGTKIAGGILTLGNPSGALFAASSGSQPISGGETAAFTIVSSGGSLEIYSGGVASVTMIDGRGAESIYSGGIDIGTTISGIPNDWPAVEAVEFGGVASNSVIENNGNQDILAGGMAIDPLIGSGGGILLDTGGVIVAPVISGGELELGYSDNSSDDGGDGTITTFGGAAILAPAQEDESAGYTVSGGIDFAPGTSGSLWLWSAPPGPGGVISGFATGDTIDLTGGTLTTARGALTLLPQNVLEIPISGGQFDDIEFDPNQSFAGETFVASATSDGGALISLARLPSPAVYWTDPATGDTGSWAFGTGGGVGGFQDLGKADAAYSAIGVGDFDGAGNLEVLWEDRATGDTGYWTMSNGAVTGFDDLGRPAPGYRFVGVSDFDEAGHDEVLWENMATGDTGYWATSGGAVTGFDDFGTANTSYTVEGTGDFDVSGNGEVLWEDTATGDTGYWTTAGGGVTGFNDFGEAAETAYSIVGIGDFDASGHDEVLWEDKATGDTGYWTTNGSTVTGFHDFGFADTAYGVIGVGDYDGSGRDEVLWEDMATGDTGYWTTNPQDQVTGFQDLGAADTSYRVVPSAAT